MQIVHFVPNVKLKNEVKSEKDRGILVPSLYLDERVI